MVNNPLIRPAISWRGWHWGGGPLRFPLSNMLRSREENLSFKMFASQLRIIDTLIRAKQSSVSSSKINVIL